jgi:hypothetical protein
MEQGWPEKGTNNGVDHGMKVEDLFDHGGQEPDFFWRGGGCLMERLFAPPHRHVVDLTRRKISPN